MGGQAREDEELTAAADRKVFGDGHERGALMAFHLEPGVRSMPRYHRLEIATLGSDHLA